MTTCTNEYVHSYKIRRFNNSILSQNHHCPSEYYIYMVINKTRKPEVAVKIVLFPSFL